MFSKVLIANRGEAAVRVIRACRDLGVRTVAVYSEADANCLHVRIADEAVCIGPAATGRSYLNVPHIVQAALMTGAEAIHPGTGFLSESAAFAEICIGYGLNFIGPLPETIWQLGDKARARTVMRDAGLPVMPGSDAPVRSLDDAKALAESLGYPVMLKAVNGGGGKGIRKLQSSQELVAAFPVAQAEASSAFGNPDIYLEKCIEDARHVEVQILGDRMARSSTLVNAIVHCSAVHRRSSRRHPRRDCRWRYATGCARRRSSALAPPTMSTQGRGSSSSIGMTTSISWRRTHACRWSIRLRRR